MGRSVASFDARYATQVAARAIAAILGGHALAAMPTAGLPPRPPPPRVQALTPAILSSLALSPNLALPAPPLPPS